MKKTLFSMSLVMILLSFNAESTCHKCERIRTFNAEHPGEFEYYDDFLEAKKETKEPTATEEEKLEKKSK